MPPTKVACFDLTPFSSGSRFRGIGMYAYELAQALSRLPAEARGGVELAFLAGRGAKMRVVPAGPSVFEELYDGEPQRSVPYQTSKRTFGRLALRRAGVDLYHAADPMGTPHLGIPRTIVTCHDLIPTLLAGPYLGGRPQWASRLEDAIRYRLPDHVIAISEATRRDVVSTLRMPGRAVTVVHHGVDHAFFSPEGAAGERAEVTRALGTDRPFFLYVGAFDPRKNVPELIEAFARVRDEVDEDLVIVGKLEPRETEQRLTIKAAARGVEDRVRLVGFLPRALLPAAYRAATAHVLPSVYEGFGMTLLEAMSCGCPVVACPVSAMPEVCGDAAQWAAPGEVDSLASALREIARDPALRARLREHGVARAATFTWARAAEQTLAVYRAVLDGG